MYWQQGANDLYGSGSANGKVLPAIKDCILNGDIGCEMTVHISMV